MRHLAGVLLAASLAASLFHGSANAWERAARLTYRGVMECPDREMMCFFVTCPATGEPSFEMMLFEHGLVTGDIVTIRVDQQEFRLPLPETGSNSRYRWALPPGMAAALQEGRTASMAARDNPEPQPFSLKGSGRAIRPVLDACEAAGTEATATGVKDLTGTYEKAGEYWQQLKISPAQREGRYRGAFEVATPGCQGDVEMSGKASGARSIRFSKADPSLPSGRCTIDVQFSEDLRSATVSHEYCGYSGPACDFNGTLEKARN